MSIRSLVLALPFVLALGCGGSDKTSPGGTIELPGAGGVTPNNMATLSGPAVGTARAARTDLTRTVPVSMVGTGFAATTMYVGRSSTTSAMDYLIVPVTNLTGSFHCFIKAELFDLTDVNGGVLESQGGSYISGRVGYSTSRIYTRTCLAPGETGYLLDITDTNVFDVVVAATIQMTFNPGAFGEPAAQVIPLSYTVTNNLETVSVKNVGTASAAIGGGFHEAIFLDGGEPVYWGFLDAVEGTVVPPSGLATLTRGISWSGSSVQQIVIVDFEDPAAANTSALTLAPSGSHVAEQQAVRTRLAALAAKMRK